MQAFFLDIFFNLVCKFSGDNQFLVYVFLPQENPVRFDQIQVILMQACL